MYKRQEARELAAMYRSQLSDIMEEWAKHTVDPTGGYITDFGEDWELVSRRKNIWAQARQTYMFAAYYEYSGHEDKWLSLAKPVSYTHLDVYKRQEPGKDADLVFLDEECNVVRTFVKGKECY